MSKIYRYFTIPFNCLPTDCAPPYDVWFATWSKSPPSPDSYAIPPLVIGVSDGELPAHAVEIGSGGKDPPPPPPPLAPVGMSEYQASVRQWLASTRDADE